MCALKHIIWQIVDGLWPFCEHPVCPDPVKKPVICGELRWVMGLQARFAQPCEYGGDEQVLLVMGNIAQVKD